MMKRSLPTMPHDPAWSPSGDSAAGSACRPAVDRPADVPMLQMVDIVKRFPGTLANDRVRLSVQRGTIHGLLGENGAGKTTLMNILYGLYSADEGHIILDGHPVTIRSPREAIALGIGMIHQRFTLIPRMTVAQNIILGHQGTPQIVRRKQAEHAIAQLAERHGIAIDPGAMVWQLSVGEQQRVEILKALYRDVRLLILDEPTSVLSPQDSAALFRTLKRMASSGLTIILISHKLDEVMSVTGSITILREGRVADVLETRQTSPRELARRMVGREVVLRVEKPEAQVGATTLCLDRVSALSDRNLAALTDISFSVAAGEIVGIAGVSGNGQAELVEVLAGVRPITSGAIQLAGQDVSQARPAQLVALGLGLIPADSRQQGSAAGLSVQDNLLLKNSRALGLARGAFLSGQAVAEYSRRMVSQFGVKTPNVALPSGKLSGGNLQRLILARELARDPVLLVADQPTKGLDVGASEFVYQQLLAARAAGRAILLVSENLDEVMMLSDRILVFYRGRIIGEVDGKAAEREQLGLLMGGRTPATGCGG